MRRGGRLQHGGLRGIPPPTHSPDRALLPLPAHGAAPVPFGWQMSHSPAQQQCPAWRIKPIFFFIILFSFSFISPEFLLLDEGWYILIGMLSGLP